MNSFIPPWEFHRIVVEPWTTSFPLTVWIVVMGALVGTACGLVGNYLLLRRMALVGDAISHSVLPGLVIAFFIFKSTHTLVMFAGALVAGIVTVVLIEFIRKHSRVKVDAAICIVFTTLFAFGVAITEMMHTGGAVHIDAECILYGEIAFVALEPPVYLAGHSLGPASVLRMGGLSLAGAFLIFVFYKELLITSFDAGLSKSMGLRTGIWHYGLMVALSLAVVGAFEAVGAIMVVAMLIIPPMFAAQISQRLPVRMGITVLHSAASALIGYHLSVWLNCSVAGAMVVAGSGLFMVVWIGSILGRKLKFRNPGPPVISDSDAAGMARPL